MSGSTIGSLAGAGIGAIVGGPGGARVGWMIGGALGGIVKPDQIKGPRLSDGQTVTSQEGIPIPFGYGTFPTGANCIWADVLVEHKHKEGGKGGPVTTNYTYTRSYAIGICEGEITAIAKAWRNGKLVYDITPTSTIAGQNAKFLDGHKFYTGSETQLVDPTIEAVVGVGNSPPMRGLAYMVAENEDLTDSGGAIAQWRFVVQKCGTYTESSGGLPPAVGYWKLDEPSGTVAYDSSGNGYDGTYSSGSCHVPAITANSTGAMDAGVSLVAVPFHAALSVGSNGSPGNPANWSICASFRIDSRGGGVPIFGSPGAISQLVTNYGSYASGYQNFFLNLVRATGQPQTGYTDMATNGKFTNGPTGIALDTTHRIWGVRTDTTMDLYLDGALIASEARSDITSWPGGADGLWIGSTMDAKMSDVGVFDVALSPAQIIADAGYFGISGVLPVPDAPGVYVDADGNLITGAAPQWEVTSCTAYLDDIVADLCERAGIDPSEYDVTDLAAIEVKGYGCATESSAQGFIEPLTQAFFFDRGEWDKKVRFILRGGASVANLDPDDLVAMDGPAIVQTRVQEVELLRKVNVLTVDPEAEFNVTKQSWERRIGTIQAKGEASVEIPIVTDHDTAAQIAEKRGKVAWAETDKFAYGLTLAHSALTPTDVVTLTDKAGVAHRQRLQAENEESGVITIEEAMKDRASTYSSTATGVQNPNLPSNDEQLIGPTLFVAMNLPQMREVDGFGMYVGLTGVLGGWAGFQLLISYDGGLSYTPALTGVEPTTMGSLTADITSSGTPLSVHVFGGELESKTADQVATGANVSAVLTGEDAEVLAYETATQTAAAGTSLDYDLTTIYRGLKSTTPAAHVAGDDFIDMATAYFLPIDPIFAGQTIWFKPVSLGTSADATEAVSYVYAPVFSSVPSTSFIETNAGVVITTDTGLYLQAQSA